MRSALALLFAFSVAAGSADVINIPWRVAFVSLPEKLHLGSFRMRGKEMAAAFSNATYGGCDIEGEFDVYVHVKYLCPNLFERQAVAHIYDVVDIAVVQIPGGKLDGVIMGSEPDIHKNCRKHSVICERIPHHVNHNCTARNESWPLRQFNGKYVIGVLGTNKYAYLNKSLPNLFPNYDILIEHDFYKQKKGLCEFYESISVALLWSDPSAFKDMGIRKPPTRMANTARVNIPMVATKGYLSYHQYDPAKKFLCDDLRCIKTTVEDMIKGKRQSEFAALKKRTDEDTSWETVTGKYQRLFSAAVQRSRKQEGRIVGKN